MAAKTGWLIPALTVTVAIVATGCTTRPQVMPSVAMFGVQGSATGHPTLHASVVHVADDYFTWQFPGTVPLAVRHVPLSVTDKLHPILQRWLVDSLATTQELMVTFIDTIPLPPLASLDPSGVRFAIERLRSQRDHAFQQDTAGYSAQFGVQGLGRHWLTQTLRLRAPVSKLRDLAQRPEVMFVRPRYAGEGPPWDGPNHDPNDDIAAGSDQMGAGKYQTLNAVGEQGGPSPVVRPWVELLDTGVRMTHEAMSLSVQIRCGDCVNGGADCHQGLAPAALTDACPTGHGTSTAHILVGDGKPSSRFSGLVRNPVDAYKVYVQGSGTCGLTLDPDAAELGFEVALSQTLASGGPAGRLILAEIAADEPFWGQHSREADHAYDVGWQVLAATGDGGTTGSVRSPANAYKAIGVGGYNVSTGRSLTAESLGPTSDGRIKPDIQAPGNAEAAGNLDDIDYHTFSGTSGSLPFAGGASALMAGYFQSLGQDIDPGTLNVLLIVSGQKSNPFDNKPVSLIGPDHPHGAGHLRLPDPSALKFGSCFLSQTSAGTETKEITIDWASGPISHIALAIWWPDSLADRPGGAIDQMHSHVDASILDPNGNEAASSKLPKSVFQRCDTPVTGSSTGFWRIRLAGHEMRPQLTPEGETINGQNVYWAVVLTSP